MNYHKCACLALFLASGKSDYMCEDIDLIDLYVF